MPDSQQQVRGRGVFAVDTSGAGIVVRTGFLSEHGQLVEMPAVFPNLGYALAQIDHLRQIVIDRFEEAAQVGVQVIAAQASTPASAASPETAGSSEASEAIISVDVGDPAPARAAGT